MHGCVQGGGGQAHGDTGEEVQGHASRPGMPPTHWPPREASVCIDPSMCVYLVLTPVLGVCGVGQRVDAQVDVQPIILEGLASLTPNKYNPLGLEVDANSLLERQYQRVGHATCRLSAPITHTLALSVPTTTCRG